MTKGINVIRLGRKCVLLIGMSQRVWRFEHGFTGGGLKPSYLFLWIIGFAIVKLSVKVTINKISTFFKHWERDFTEPN